MVATFSRYHDYFKHVFQPVHKLFDKIKNTTISKYYFYKQTNKERLVYLGLKWLPF